MIFFEKSFTATGLEEASEPLLPCRTVERVSRWSDRTTGLRLVWSGRRGMAQSGRMLNLGFTPERLREGTHACFLFSDEAERRSVIYPYVRAGLRDLENVYYYADALATELLERANGDVTRAR